MTQSKTDALLLIKRRKEQAVRIQRDINNTQARIVDQQRQLQDLRAALGQVKAEYQIAERLLEAETVELEQWYVLDREPVNGWVRCFFPTKVHKDGKLGGVSIKIQDDI